MKIVDLDIPVGRRTVLTCCWNEQGHILRTEKTARALLEWLDGEVIHEVVLWSGGKAWTLKRNPEAVAPEWSQRAEAHMHVLGKD